MRPFEEIVDEHGPVVMRVCRALLGPADAEDAWSETFLSALRAYPDLRPGQQRAGLAGDDRPPQGDRPAPRRRPARPSRPATCPRRPGDDLPDARRASCGRALEALPPKQRGAVIYHYLADLPYAEVAAAARQQRGRGPAQRRRRHRQPPQDPPEGSTTMSTDAGRSAGPSRAWRRRRRLRPARRPTTLRARLADRGRADGPARRRLPHRRQPVRPVAARGQPGGPGAGGLRAGGPRRRPRPTRRRHQPADPACARPARRPWPASSTSTSPAGAARFDVPVDLRLAHGFRRAVIDAPAGRSPTAPPRATPRWPGPPGTRARCGRSGSACAHNPVPLVVPCHRVIRSDGTLGQYLGGAEAKAALLGYGDRGVTAVARPRRRPPSPSGAGRPTRLAGSHRGARRPRDRALTAPVLNAPSADR